MERCFDWLEESDITATPIFKAVEEFCRKSLEPGFGEITGGYDITANPKQLLAAFTGTSRDSLESQLTANVCIVDLALGRLKRIERRTSNSKLARWSPDGKALAFATDSNSPGVFQLAIADGPDFKNIAFAPELPGTVEYLDWSPDGQRILVGVAGFGADLAGMQGALNVPNNANQQASWMPKVETGQEAGRWRSVWMFDLTRKAIDQVSPEGLNVWESCWCGNTSISAIATTAPGEDAWYEAFVTLIDVVSREHRKLYQPDDQIGWIAASPTGDRIAVCDGFTSDRFGVAGDLCLIYPANGKVEIVPTRGVDVAWVVWRSNERLMFAGVRGLETVVANLDLESGDIDEIWRSTDLTCGVEMYPEASPIGDNDCLIIAENHSTPPAMARVGKNTFDQVLTLGHAGSTYAAQASGVMQPYYWTAPDGLGMEGWLVLPRDRPGPHPVVTIVHGGPVSTWRNLWQRRRIRLEQVLTHFGYAAFLPNPRGAVGRGREFAKHVMGDMGGLDTKDISSGIDALIGAGIADPERLGITGISYGGFMSSWIITQDPRFAASIPVSPVTNWYSFHWTTNISAFDRIFLQDSPTNPEGAYFHRSPVMFAGQTRTPTLNIAGALDLCTPPTQAEEFHKALLEAGVESNLVIYPQEGHGIAKSPAVIDYSARILGWLGKHMSV